MRDCIAYYRVVVLLAAVSGRNLSFSLVQVEYTAKLRRLLSLFLSHWLIVIIRHKIYLTIFVCVWCLIMCLVSDFSYYSTTEKKQITQTSIFFFFITPSQNGGFHPRSKKKTMQLITSTFSPPKFFGVGDKSFNIFFKPRLPSLSLVSFSL